MKKKPVIDRLYGLFYREAENAGSYWQVAPNYTDFYCLAAIRAKFPTDTRTDKELLKLVREELGKSPKHF